MYIIYHYFILYSFSVFWRVRFDAINCNWCVIHTRVHLQWCNKIFLATWWSFSVREVTLVIFWQLSANWHNHIKTSEAEDWPSIGWREFRFHIFCIASCLDNLMSCCTKLKMFVPKTTAFGNFLDEIEIGEKNLQVTFCQPHPV